MESIVHACESVPDTTAFVQMPAHTLHSVRLPTGQGCDTHACKPDKLTRDAGHDGRTPFSPIAATPLNVPKFLHSKLNTGGFVGAGEQAAASLPVVWGQPLLILTGRSVATRSGFVASTAAPSLQPTSHARPNDPRSRDGSNDSHGETAPGSVPSFLPAQVQLEIPSSRQALGHLYSSAT